MNGEFQYQCLQTPKLQYPYQLPRRLGRIRVELQSMVSDVTQLAAALVKRLKGMVR